MLSQKFKDAVKNVLESLRGVFIPGFNINYGS